MDHWFDTLTRNLYRQPLTRRTMISWTTRLGLAAGVGLLGRNTSVVAAAPVVADPPTASTCTATDSYGVLKTVVTTASGDPTTPLMLTHTFVAEVGSGAASSTLTITPGPTTPVRREDIVLRFTTTLASKRGHASAMFGKHYTGSDARGGSFETDGRTLNGHVDGRATEPVPLGTDVKGVRFKDGQTHRPLQAPTVHQSVAALLAQSRRQLGACGPDPKASPAVSTCSKCQLTCRQTWVDCSVAAAQSSLAAGTLAAGAYLGVASATCDAAFQTCLATCKSSGACCPDFCKGDAACCQSAWGCCPPSSASSRSWSKAWPTCPRCGTPPWPTAAKPSAPRRPPARPRTRP